MKSNTVTLFSNGIGHFRRHYEVPKGGCQISIPFKSASIGDVAASLQVFGRVRISSPPSFTPGNANTTSLDIKPAEAIRSLLTQLSGARVKLFLSGSTPVDDFTLLGIDKVIKYTPAGNIEEPMVVLQSQHGVVHHRLDHIIRVEFLDQAVKTEIDKALKNNFQKIKPDSTLMDISLASDEATEVTVTYTIPVAAWKMRYSVRQEGSVFTLDGAAIIDNNTDEDWDNFVVSVVTGNPISFRTDIANVVIPQRSFVSVVEGAVLGNVRLEESVQTAKSAVRSRGVAMASPMAASASYSNRASFGFENQLEGVGGVIEEDDECYDMAEAAGAEAKEVGDFCLFINREPITILSRRSAVVPMFQTTLTQAGLILVYKEKDHARRPFRAVKFKNDTTYSLGKGKLIVFNRADKEDVFQGECVLEPTKPGDNRILPHCLENRVKIVRSIKDRQQRRNSIQISRGVVVDESLDTAVIEYSIENKTSEPFKLVLEHVQVLGRTETKVSFSGVEVKETEKLPSGWRLYIDLAPNQEATLRVTEEAIWSQQVILNEWSYMGTYIATAKPLSEDANVKACAEIQEEIDDNMTACASLQERVKELTEQINRVRQNLSVASDKSAELTSKWVKDLDDSENEIREITKKLTPDLQKKIKELRGQMREALKKILVSWTYKEPKAFVVTDAE